MKRNLLKPVVLWLISLAFLGAGGWLCLASRVTDSLPMLAVGSFVLLLLHSERFEFFKGFNIELKTRELQTATSDAMNALEEIKQVKEEVAALKESLQTAKEETLAASKAFDEAVQEAQRKINTTHAIVMTGSKPHF